MLTRLARLFRSRVALTTDAAHDGIMDAITTGHSAGGVETEHRNRLLGALDLHQRTVEEIMRHRRAIEMIDADDSPDEIVAQVLASRYTRLPVFRDGTENILGVLHAKDLLREVDGGGTPKSDAPAVTAQLPKLLGDEYSLHLGFVLAMINAPDSHSARAPQASSARPNSWRVSLPICWTRHASIACTRCRSSCAVARSMRS